MSELNPDRRPIAARNLQFSQLVTKKLVAAGISPNAISVSSIFFGTSAGILFSLTSKSTDAWRVLFILGVICVLLRLLANMFDGMVAVATQQSSKIGELYNEIPDRISDTIIFVGFGYALSGNPTAGLWAAIAAMLTAYTRAVGKAAGAHQEFCGPFAKQQRMFFIMMASLYLACTPPTWHVLPGSSIGVAGWVLIVIALGSFYTTFRRLLRISHALEKGPL